MIWYSGYYLNKIQKYSSTEWTLRFSTKTIERENPEGPDPIIETVWLEKTFNHEPSLREVKDALIGFIEEYDNSEEVNGFYINDSLEWISKDTRVGLVNSIGLEKSLSRETTEVWTNSGSHLEIPCDTALEILKDIELYAIDCYRVTQKHKSLVENSKTLQDLIDLDITSDYPEKLKFSL